MRITSIGFAQGNAWTMKANMLTARSGPSTCVVNGKVYVIGGVKDANSSTIKTVEEFDPATDTWTTKTKMPTARGYLSASAVNGKIYAIGGGRTLSTSGLSTLEEYNPSSDPTSVGNPSW